MQQDLVNFYIEYYDLFDSEEIVKELKWNMIFDMHAQWLYQEEYEICALYKDAIKNCEYLFRNSL